MTFVTTLIVTGFSFGEVYAQDKAPDIQINGDSYGLTHGGYVKWNVPAIFDSYTLRLSKRVYLDGKLFNHYIDGVDNTTVKLDKGRNDFIYTLVEDETGEVRIKTRLIIIRLEDINAKTGGDLVTDLDNMMRGESPEQYMEGREWASGDIKKCIEMGGLPLDVRLIAHGKVDKIRKEDALTIFKNFLVDFEYYEGHFNHWLYKGESKLLSIEGVSDTEEELLVGLLSIVESVEDTVRFVDIYRSAGEYITRGEVARLLEILLIGFEMETSPYIAVDFEQLKLTRHNGLSDWSVFRSTEEGNFYPDRHINFTEMCSIAYRLTYLSRI